MGGVVLLAGGTGGAKLARGVLDVVGAELTVIANTGDDVDFHGARVCPDPDLVTFWLADRIDPRGWGLLDDTFAVCEGLRALGEDVWFNLGDRDFAIGLRRAERLQSGGTLTDALDELRRAFAVPARVLPATDDRVATHVKARGRWFAFQTYMVRERAPEPVEGVEFRGADAARPAPDALAAIAAADAILVGPSNPVLSIDPMLAVPGLRAALTAAAAPVVAVSPLVGGRVLKGPTAACLQWAGDALDTAGIVRHYGDLLDGIVADEGAAEIPVHRTDVGLADPAARARVAEATLAFAATLS